MKAKIVIELDDRVIEIPLTIVQSEVKQTEATQGYKLRSPQQFNKAILGVLYAIKREKGEEYTPTVLEIRKALEVAPEEVKAFEDALNYLKTQGVIDVFSIQDTRYVRLINREEKPKKEKKSIRRFKDVVK